MIRTKITVMLQTVVLQLWGRSQTVNGFALEIENGGVGDGNSARSSGEGFRTYKRRRYTKIGSSETKLFEDGKVYLESTSQLTDKTVKEPSGMVLHNSSCDQLPTQALQKHALMNGSDNCRLKHWGNDVLVHIYQSLGESGGGIAGCIQEALLVHSESSCRTAVKESVHFHEDRPKCPSQKGWTFNGSQNAAKGHVGVMSNGLLNESNYHTVTELCKRAFLDIVISEKFAQLCKLLSEGMRVDSFFDIGLLNSRMKDGACESTPTLFNSDIQQMGGPSAKLVFGK